MTITVKTKAELKQVLKAKPSKFVVQGELVDSIKKSSKVTKLSKTALVILSASIAAIAAAPTTGGISGVAGVGSLGFVAATAPAAAGGVVSMTVILAVLTTGGLTIVLALYKDYDVKYSMGPSGLSAEFTRK